MNTKLNQEASILKLDWNKVKERYKKDPITFTKEGDKFQIGKITETVLFLDLPCGEKSIRRKHLEKAVELINKGKIINNPEDYVKLVNDKRATNAWAILRDMGFTK